MFNLPGSVLGGAAGNLLSSIAYPFNAPQRALNSAAMNMMGNQTGTSENQGSVIPALLGALAGGASAFTPLAGFAPMIGVGTAGLAQMLGHAISPGQFKDFSTGDVLNRMSPGYAERNPLMTMGISALTDPLIYAGAATGGTKLGQASSAEQGLARTLASDASHKVNYTPAMFSDASAAAVRAAPYSEASIAGSVNAADRMAAASDPLGSLARDFNKLMPQLSQDVGGVSAAAEARLARPFISGSGQPNLPTQSLIDIGNMNRDARMLSNMGAETDAAAGVLQNSLADVARRRPTDFMTKYPMPEPVFNPPTGPALGQPMMTSRIGGPDISGGRNIDVMRPMLEAFGSPVSRRVNPAISEVLQSYGLAEPGAAGRMNLFRGIPDAMELRGGWVVPGRGYAQIPPAMGNEGFLNLLMNS